MVNRSERAMLQKSVIDDLNLHINEEIHDKLREHKSNGGVFSACNREVFYFQTPEQLYSVYCCNVEMNIYRVCRSTAYVNAENKIVCRKSSVPMMNEVYEIIPVASATSSERKYCEPYNNHIAKRTEYSTTKKSNQFRFGQAKYLDMLLTGLLTTPNSSVIAPDPQFQTNDDKWSETQQKTIEHTPVEEIIEPPVVVVAEPSVVAVVAEPPVVVVEPPLDKSSKKKRKSSKM